MWDKKHVHAKDKTMEDFAQDVCVCERNKGAAATEQ